MSLRTSFSTRVFRYRTAAPPELDTPYGRMAGLADPSGAVFMVIEPDAASQPDRSG